MPERCSRNKTRKKIQNWKTKFSKEIQMLKKTQAEIKMQLKNSTTQVQNSGKELQVGWTKQKLYYQDLKLKQRNLTTQENNMNKYFLKHLSSMQEL